MSDLNFLKDLLKINQDSFSMNEEEKKKMLDFNKGLRDGFLSKFDGDQKKIMEETWNDKTLDEVIEGIGNQDDVDLMGMMDKIIEKFSEEDIFTHNNVSIDPTNLFNKYHELKAKYKKHKESEDINNF